MSAPIAITGASGQFGGAVARSLAQSGVSLRLLVRDAAKAPSLPNSTVHVASYDDADAVTKALEGVETVLLVSVGVEGDRAKIHASFVDAAKRAGVKRIAYTSYIKPAADASFLAGVSHGQTEDHIRATGLSLIALRNGLYSEVASQLVAPGTGKIFGSAKPSNGYAPLGRNEMALATAKVLENASSHDGKSYDLVGERVISLTEIAEVLTDVTGSPVTYVQVPYAAVVDGLAKAFGGNRHAAEHIASMYLAIDDGELSVTGTDFERLTGRKPADLRTYLKSL